MSDLVKIHNSNNKKGHLVKEPQAKVVLHSKQQQDVAIAPGSMSAYLKIKENLRQEELRGKQRQALIQKLSLQNLEVQTSKSKCSLGHELEEEHENSTGLRDCDLEPERDEDAEHDGVHFGNDNQLEVQTDPLIEQDVEDNLVADPSKRKQKRTRGPTVCKDVLEWTLDDHKLIILNEIGEPVGPDKKTVDKFIRFIGTISRNFTLAPLNKISWHHVLDKDKIWNYVKCEGTSLFCLDNDVDRLNHAPDIIPEKYFMDLIEYWNLDVVQVCLLCSVFLGEYAPSLVYVYTIMHVLSFHLCVLCSN
ncbi:hypothetical protein LIER_06060 [Lithospermum erythrorhizon]|uniref:Uncharacterized protein n=1 Tax=Lithospermum erythrorhizon TaxID=34254 RepID=A0AAV3P339_LITER